MAAQMLIFTPSRRRKNNAITKCSAVYLHFTLNFAAHSSFYSGVVIPKQKICQLCLSAARVTRCETGDAAFLRHFLFRPLAARRVKTGAANAQPV